MRKELIVLPAEEGDLQSLHFSVYGTFRPFPVCGKGLFTSQFVEVKRNCQGRRRACESLG